jgi:hypothetical protein
VCGREFWDGISDAPAVCAISPRRHLPQASLARRIPRLGAVAHPEAKFLGKRGQLSEPFPTSRKRLAQRGGAASRFVEASGAGPGPNAVRPYLTRKSFANQKRIHNLALQNPALAHSSPDSGGPICGLQKSEGATGWSSWLWCCISPRSVRKILAHGATCPDGFNRGPWGSRLPRRG